MNKILEKAKEYLDKDSKQQYNKYIEKISEVIIWYMQNGLIMKQKNGVYQR